MPLVELLYSPKNFALPSYIGEKIITYYECVWMPLVEEACMLLVELLYPLKDV